MPFTMPQFPLLNSQQTSPFGNLIQNALQTYQQAQQARYTPQMLQAEIFNKEFAPLGQIASSPLALAMLPDQQKQMAAMISQLLSQTGSGNNSSMTSAIANSLGSTGSNATTGGNGTGISTVPQTNSTSNGTTNPNLPSSNFGTAVGQQTQANYTGQLHEPGKGYTTPAGKNMVASSSDIVSRAQLANGAIDNLNNLIPAIQEEAPEFLNTGSTSNLISSELANRLNKFGFANAAAKIASFGGEDNFNKAGRYTTTQGKITQAIEQLKLIYPSPNTEGLYKRYAAMLEMQPGDNEVSYKNRLDSILTDLNEKVLPVIKKAMGSQGGYNIDAETNNAINPNKKNNSQQTSDQSNVPSQGAKDLSNKLQLPSFPNKKAFQDWYKRQPKMVKDAVKLSLGNS